ncbi:preprotein translocase subunit SecE [Paracrocinitomix mangrovi]|uniref:preprotein translocase subunit SecE n=1 Tax=Paracrocinitomix mangrovi TaxID=2862509 RepID=UPI001C8DA9A6|nr:preprotein translocase subunit SecE [Paracrocinitomix mangrovi]UKN01027.1 preprotein translocase subunit SecE [Paracrocinitomix mangrovi]
MANIVKYIEESYNELVHKVTWPTWDQLQSSSIVVLVASVIFALLIFIMDYLFGINVQHVEGQTEFGIWKGLLGFYYDLRGAY